jgi:hypothetical protein
MNQPQGMQVQLPTNLTLQLVVQDVIAILAALGDSGPHKLVNPIIRNIEQQLLAQQLPQTRNPPVPPPPAANDVPVDVGIAEEVAHHRV